MNTKTKLSHDVITRINWTSHFDKPLPSAQICCLPKLMHGWTSVSSKSDTFIVEVSIFTPFEASLISIMQNFFLNISVSMERDERWYVTCTRRVTFVSTRVHVLVSTRLLLNSHVRSDFVLVSSYLWRVAEHKLCSKNQNRRSILLLCFFHYLLTHFKNQTSSFFYWIRTLESCLIFFTFAA